ncbi:MAG: hypothetical protein RJQ09_21770 [Cyclobacteriaceae bacterium]
MKKSILLIALFGVMISLQAQDRVRERDLLGEWKLIIDLDEDEIMEDIEDDEDIPFFAEWIAESAMGLVGNILDELDIYFTFKEDGKLKVVAEIFGEREIEYTDWYINSNNEVIIGDTDNVDLDDEVWVMERGRLYAYDRNRSRRDHDAEIYMIRVD